jgi:hypothetical protein
MNLQQIKYGRVEIYRIHVAGSCKGGMYIPLQSVVPNLLASGRTVSISKRILILHGVRQQENISLYLRGVS